jgi:hypothetical protein
MQTVPTALARNFEVTTSGNGITLSGRFDIVQLRKGLAAIRELVVDRGYMDIQLDFSKCIFTHAPAMLGFATATEYYQESKIDFDLILPEDDSLQRLFKNSNWAHIIEPKKFPLSDFSSPIHMPALRYTTSAEQHRLVGDILNKMLGSITDFDRSHFKALEWSIN